ncbi:MAG: hypothetical protein HC884_00285 [Chloroflexaceae bacterium]|nr:hypothetical protein [Chloroflexaceae bacterium]
MTTSDEDQSQHDDEVMALRQRVSELEEAHAAFQEERAAHQHQHQQIEERWQQCEATLRMAHEQSVIQRQQHGDELRRIQKELAHAVQVKDHFLAAMSHELRTPLNGILGLSEALQEEVYGPLNERQRRVLHLLEQNGYRLLTIVNDILDLSHIESGGVRLEIAPVVIGALCQSCLELVQQDASRKRLVVSFKKDTCLVIIQADERRLKQVLINLLSNAVKFTPDGGNIGLDVTANLSPGQRAVQFAVWDTGIGIAAEDIGRLFHPFAQIHTGLTRQYEGAGLGLVLAARLVELHGGQLTVESTLGQGSRFIVSLPLADEENL